MTIARRVIVTGQVQGVFFRAWTKEQAETLGISGWVRNCPDGSVEAQVEGPEAAVEQMIERMRDGPPHAQVDHLSVEETTPESSDRFEIRH